MADCSRQMQLTDHSEGHKERLRRYLWFWCSRADGLSRYEHQHLSRELPETSDMLTVDEYKELIHMSYDSGSEGEAAAVAE